MMRERAIARGLAIFGAIWQVLWLAAEPGLRTLVIDEPTDPSTLLILMSLLAWLALWPVLLGGWGGQRALWWIQSAIVASLTLSGLLLIGGSRVSDADGWLFGASVVNLAAGLAGVSFPRKVGSLVVGIIVAIEAAIIIAVHLRGDDTVSLAVDLIYPLYALALGAAAIASRYGLLESARSSDQADADLALQQQVQATTEFADASINAAETRLHETVLNTLTAIDRGGFDSSPATEQRLRERAGEAAGVLRMIAEGADISAAWAGDLAVDLAAEIVDLQAQGVRVRTSGAMGVESGKQRALGAGRAPNGEDVSAEYVAMASAVRELLLNVARHADAREVSITADVTNVQGRSWWRVVVRDDGRGFDPSHVGYGLRNVVIDGLGQAGGRVSITSHRGRGSEATLEVSLAPTDPPTWSTTPSILVSIGGPVVTAFALFTVYVFLATWGFAQSPIANLFAMAVYGATVAVLAAVIVLRRNDVAPGWLVVGVCVVVPVIARLESIAGAPEGPTADWSSEAGSALLFVVVATGPWWAAPLAIAAWFVAQEAQLVELTQPGTIVIVVAAILGWTLRRSMAQASARRAAIDEQRGALAQSQERLRVLRHRYAEIDTEGLITLLEGIGDGDIDPRDPTIRSQCAREERMIRSVLLLHPESSATDRELVALAALARERGIDLSIAAVPNVPDEVEFSLFPAAGTLLRLAPEGSTARASVTVDGAQFVLRVVVNLNGADLARIPAVAEVLDEEVGLVAIEERCGLDVDATD